MCLIVFGFNPAPALRLLLVGNRDEFHARPSAPLSAWAARADVLGGRDLIGDGTWLGLSPRGRLAAVTNVRLPGLPATGLRSRGLLARDYLLADSRPEPFLLGQHAAFTATGPCNLLLVDAKGAYYASNQPTVQRRPLPAGLYGLSNASLDTPWPKTVALKNAVSAWVQQADFDDPAPLFAALADDRAPPDRALPDTGVGLARERFVAPAFIRHRDYGTRCSSVVRVDVTGAGCIIERRFGPEGVLAGETRIDFRWPV